MALRVLWTGASHSLAMPMWGLKYLPCPLLRSVPMATGKWTGEKMTLRSDTSLGSSALWPLISCFTSLKMKFMSRATNFTTPLILRLPLSNCFLLFFNSTWKGGLAGGWRWRPVAPVDLRTALSLISATEESYQELFVMLKLGLRLLGGRDAILPPPPYAFGGGQAAKAVKPI